MIMRVLARSSCCGAVAGAVAGAVQVWRISPLIRAAEVYEVKTGGGNAHAQGAQSRDAGLAKSQLDHGHGGNTWVPREGLERIAFTFVSMLVMGVAFALILVAAVLFSGRDITPRNGAMWGLAGFIVFTAAPAAGLAPGLPGMPAGDLVLQQVWWWGTALATAAGIALLVLQSQVVLKALGVVLIALPHVIGAPQAGSGESAVPAVLAAEFAATSIAAMALFWVVLGVALGWAMDRANRNLEA